VDFSMYVLRVERSRSGIDVGYPGTLSRLIGYVRAARRDGAGSGCHRIVLAIPRGNRARVAA